MDDNTFGWLLCKLYSFHRGLFMVLIKNNGKSHYDELLCDILNWDNIPSSTVFDHKGLGVVIGRKVVLGENVRLGQHVTLGTRGGSHVGVDDYPIIEDGVVIHEHSSVLGGVTVGHDSVVGAHSLVLSDVPPCCLVVGVPARVVKK